MKKLFLIFFMAGFLFFSCSSIKQPSEIQQVPDYTDEDVVQNEISRIKKIQSQEAVRALWRSILLGNQDLIDECTQLLKNQIEVAFEQKDYYEALRMIKSLENIDFAAAEAYSHSLEAIKEAIPLFSAPQSSDLPENITECINSTVTVWVDRGLKVENGMGAVDVVLGSGFFIDKRGYIITNHHVIDSMVDSKYEGYSRLYIKLPFDMDNKIPARVVGYDPVMDLALLKVEIVPEHVFALGSSSDLQVGDKVSAIGTPIGLEGTLTSGIVSSVERKLMTLGYVFQIDAAVNSGNSGGPLIDEKQKVQAIVFAGILQFQGLNFAIPVEFLKQELPLLYKGGEFGHVWIGSYGRTKKIRGVKSGLEIQYVMPGSSAAYSGLLSGDVITSLDGKKIDSLESFQFVQLSFQPGTMLKCTFERDGEEKSALLYMEKRPEYPLKAVYQSDYIADSFLPIFGMKLIPTSTIGRKSYKIERVLNGTTADELGFSENDPVTVRDIKFLDENEYFIAQVYVQRRKKGFLDIGMVLSAPYDSPYYF